MTDYPTTCYNTSCPRHDQSESGCIDSGKHYVGLCVGFDPGPELRLSRLEAVLAAARALKNAHSMYGQDSDPPELELSALYEAVDIADGDMAA